MLELAVLGLLKERAMHGYELRKQMISRLGFFWTVSFGSLYPTLRKMEKRGVVEKVRAAEPGHRRKQIYRITETGEAEFLELLEGRSASTWEEEKFPLRLTFFRYLRPETRVRLLERRKAYLQDKLEVGRRSLAGGSGSKADPYTLSLMRHGVEATERDITWLDELIAAEHETALAEQGGPTSEQGTDHDVANASEDGNSTTDSDPDDDRTSLQSQ